jgi:hypothetical protein
MGIDKFRHGCNLLPFGRRVLVARVRRSAGKMKGARFKLPRRVGPLATALL